MPGLDLEPMVRQIGRHAELGDDDRAALGRLPFTTRTFKAGAYLAKQGEKVREHLVLLSGFTQRHKLVQSGGRQIIAIQLPGEAISCCGLFFDRADHYTQALTAVETAVIPRDIFRRLVLERQAISHAMLAMSLIEASVSGEWLLNMGRRPAKVRIAHLLCEVAARLDAAGLSDGSRYEIPLTQEQMGDALGLTPVHVNRMLRELGEDRLVERDGRSFVFPNRGKLEHVADFDRAYLRIAPVPHMPFTPAKASNAVSAGSR